jgi:hypothetical protein
MSAYCKGEVDKAKKIYETRVLTLEKAGLNLNNVPGMEAELKMMKALFAGLDKLNPAWKKFMDTGESPGFDTDLPHLPCYPIPTVKAYILRAAVDRCKYGPEMLQKIKEVLATNTHPVPSDVQEKIDWLEKEVGNSQEEVNMVNKAWKEFLPTEKLAKKTEFTFDYPCARDAQIKAYVMVGMTEICVKGEEMVKNIEKTRKEHNPQLDATTLEKIKKLDEAVKKQKQELATLNKAWEEFTPQDTLTSGIKFVYEYCDKLAQVRAYTMTGIIEYCTRGPEMLGNISKTVEKFNVEVDDVTKSKIEKLKAMVEKSDTELKALNALWKEFISKKDTLEREFTTADFYCDKIAQIKSWTIKGHIKACAEGQQYLNYIDAYQKRHSLKYDKELECAVTRLRQKVWDCRYWELVMQARKETHEERERFGPKSAEVMKMDLNSKKMPCETTVDYAPLGNIGIKYTINTYMCANVDLAKMGDPEYYKKIAKWVDTEVLSKYCLANMRCKEEFFIYLEGHTDGNPFPGASYKDPLNIPQGMEFTHFVGKAKGANDTLSKKTDRLITTSLKNNMELGLARAWTVKQQLDFMKVPIKVGAYEHPASEKGGQYRKVEIQLNITNLLLDFYEKRLADLLKASGIGDRPKDCIK